MRKTITLKAWLEIKQITRFSNELTSLQLVEKTGVSRETIRLIRKSRSFGEYKQLTSRKVETKPSIVTQETTQKKNFFQRLFGL